MSTPQPRLITCGHQVAGQMTVLPPTHSKLTYSTESKGPVTVCCVPCWMRYGATREFIQRIGHTWMNPRLN